MKKMGSGTQTWDRMVINRVARDSLAVIVLCIGPFGISLEAKAPDLPDAMHNPFASNPAAVPAGKLLYEQTCQDCHGGDGKGDRGLTLGNLGGTSRLAATLHLPR